jgi:hypothetical protein
MEQGQEHRLGGLATEEVLECGRNRRAHDRIIRSFDREINSIYHDDAATGLEPMHRGGTVALVSKTVSPDTSTGNHGRTSIRRC